MEDIHFETKRDFLRYLSTANRFPKSVQGTQGTVYRKDDLVIKDLGKKPTVETAKLLQFRDLEIKDFYFVKAAIYLQKKLRACITKYAEGTTLSTKVIERQEIALLLEALTHLIEDADRLSEEKIRVQDIRPGNILFDQDHFNFIDTVGYYYSGESVDNIKYLNMFSIMRIIYSYTLPDSIYAYFKRSGLLDNIGTQDPRDRLLQFQRTLEHRLGEPISTFKDAEKIAKKKLIIL